MMKRVIPFLFLLLGFSTQMHAQGNLQYNQTIFLEWQATLAPAGTPFFTVFGNQNFTVPAGKTWKIESVYFSLAKSSFPANFTLNDLVVNGTNSSNNLAFVFLNETVIYSTVNTSGGSGAKYTEPQIIWLPPGNYTFSLLARPSTGLTNVFSCQVSAIEFNVVP